ncbi:DNA primase [Streptococcaceae bacterium ESL0687]|nr:DNA primase [Streptococcaceae bacterium ESL0687]
MAKLDREEIAVIKSSVNIVDVISQYIALTKTGRNYLGLCPFHGEKTPSFNVNSDKQFYHCFGCGKSGDVIKFLEDYKQISFLDSVKEVAAYAGINLEIDEGPKRENPHQSLFDIHAQASKFYHMVLTSTELGKKAKEYLYARGIDDQIIEQFGIGLAPDEPDILYQFLANKFEEKVLSESGLFTFTENKIFDSFRNRIMFPLANEHNHIIAFSGRIWTEQAIYKKEAKYKNSPATPIFNKSYELYNLNRAKAVASKSKEVYLMEGFMDVIAAYKAGVTNVVATMGTALTSHHVKKLARIVNNFILLYDGDKAGQNAAYKSLSLLAGKKVQIVQVPDNLDPDEYEKKYPGTLKTLMERGRVSETEFLIDYLKPLPNANLEEESNYLDKIIPLIASELSTARQSAYLNKLEGLLPTFTYQKLEELVRRQENTNQINQEVQADWEPNFNRQPVHAPVRIVQEEYSPKLSRLEKTEQYLLQRLISHPYLLNEIMDDEDFSFRHKNYQRLFEAVLLQYMSLERIDETQLVHSLPEDLSNLWYQMKSLNLPKQLAKEEIKDVLKAFVRENKLLKLEDLKKQLDVAKKTGNLEKEMELTLEFIKQKKLLD